MPALRICAQVGCPTLVTGGRCADHRKFDGRRSKARGRVYHGCEYNSTAWRKLRAEVLAEARFLCHCDEHMGADDAPIATVVDHVIPHQGNAELFWDKANLRAMAKRCHDTKTAKDDAGFGNIRRAEP